MIPVNETQLPIARTGAVVGFVLLAVPAVLLFALGALGASFSGQLPIGVGVLLVGAALIVVGIRHEWRAVRRVPEWRPIDPEESLYITLSILAGTVATLAGVVELGLTPVVSAAVVGIVAAISAPDRAVPAYCGAFVGMTSPLLFVTYWHAAIAAAVASVVFVLAQPVFHGVGGKLGTTAFVGAVVTVLVTTETFQSDPLPPSAVVSAVVVVSIVGAIVTFSLQTRTDASPVLASGIVGAVGGVFLPLISEYGVLLAAAVFSASFAGMSDSERIPDERWMAVSGLFVGLVVVYTAPYLGGSGGKLGTIAFGSCLGVYGIVRTIKTVQRQRRIRSFSRRDTT